MDCPDCVAEERGAGRCAVHTPTFYALATAYSNATDERGPCSQCERDSDHLFLISIQPRMLACRQCLTDLSTSGHDLGDDHEPA